MTQVDFYILKDNSLQAQNLLTCRLSEKAYKQGHQVFINTNTGEQLKQLDDMLWTFTANSFLPHGRYGENADSTHPVLLGHAIEPEGPSDVLLNLCSDVPAFFSRFNRVAELVGGDETQRQAARERYRFYKDRGYTLNTHNL
jgi:DNA polymerase-3 subunit chi